MLNFNFLEKGLGIDTIPLYILGNDVINFEINLVF